MVASCRGEARVQQHAVLVVQGLLHAVRVRGAQRIQLLLPADIRSHAHHHVGVGLPDFRQQAGGIAVALEHAALDFRRSAQQLSVHIRRSGSARP